MKIVIATAVYFPMINGVAVFSHNLARGLAARGHEVLVLTPSQKGKSYEAFDDGMRVFYLKSVEAKVYPDQIHKAEKKFRLFYRHGFRVSVFPGPEVKRILDAFSPDVVHVQVSDPIGLSVVSYARKHGIPVVTTEHNQPEVLTEPLKVPKVAKKPIDTMLANYFANRQSKSDFVTMPTKQAIYNLLEGRDFKVPVAAVSNGVDLSSFKPGRVLSSVREKYGVPAGRPVVLYVGRVDPEKNVGAVLSAFSSVVEKIPEALFVVVGDGVDLPNLKKEAKRLGISKSVKFLGRVTGEDLCEVYKMGMVFATASEIETQGIVLIEAAASGLPLIAVDKGAVSEICVAGVNGFLCRPGDVSEMAAAIYKLLSNKDLRERFSKKSVELAREHDFERTLDQFINIYRHVISEYEKRTS